MFFNYLVLYKILYLINEEINTKENFYISILIIIIENDNILKSLIHFKKIQDNVNKNAQ